MYGVLCRILLYSSLALGTNNSITVELSTPAAVAPDGVLLCAAAPRGRYAFARGDASIASLQEGGDIWTLSETEVAAPASTGAPSSADAQQPWFQTGWPLRPIQVGWADSVLGSGPYYSNSYTASRYDDLDTDQDGAPIPAGALRAPAGAAASAAAAAAARTSPAAAEPAGAAADAAAAAAAEQLASSQDADRAPGNCVLITGQWKRQTRYQLTLTIPNPPAGTTGAVDPPVLWMAPVTYAYANETGCESSGGGGGGGSGGGGARGAPAGCAGGGSSQELAFSVRGSKRGALCAPRPALAVAAPGPLFDACAAAAAAGLVAAGAADVQECLKAMRLGASGAASTPAGSPFRQPPVRALALGSFAEAACPAPAAALGPRLGGECVACGNGTSVAAAAGGGRARCACYPGYEERLAGAAACGAPLLPRGGGAGSGRAANASDAAAVAAQLCTDFAAAARAAATGRLADRAAARLALRAFSRRAAWLADEAELAAANATFWRDYDADGRAPAFATRRHGVGPGCNRCSGGRFADIYSGQMVAPRDDKFEAVRALRLIGFVLAGAGHPCPALWDPADPSRNDYGPHDRAMCLGSFDMPGPGAAAAAA